MPPPPRSPAVAGPAVAWSPPPPPRSPAVAGRRPNQGGGAGVAVDDDGVGGCTAADKGRFNPAAQLAPSSSAGQPCRQFGKEKALQWLGVVQGRSTLCDTCAVRYRSGSMVPPVRPPASIPTFSPELRFDWHDRVELHRRPAKFPVRYRSGSMVPPVHPPASIPTFSPALRFDWHNRVELHRRPAKLLPAAAGEWPSNKDAIPAVKGMPPAWARPHAKRVRTLRRRVLELSPPRTPPPLRRRGGGGGGEAAAVERGRVGEGGPAAVPAGGGEEPAARAAAPRAPAASRRRCRHCGSEKTPQWRGGPEGRHTLCNACGVRYRSGRLVPEYRPASSPTFSPGLHSNCHRQVVQLRRRREESAEVSPAAAGDK
ncbi:unnamed protein product [Urochloa humidicola]